MESPHLIRGFVRRTHGQGIVTAVTAVHTVCPSARKYSYVDAAASKSCIDTALGTAQSCVRANIRMLMQPPHISFGGCMILESISIHTETAVE